MLRTEVTFMLDFLGISVDDLIYLDSPQISEIKDKHMRVHLVDHNKYDNSYLTLKSYEVASIVDHHEDENEPCTGYWRAGAKVCRGRCGIAIFGVYRDKSRYLTFAATVRDNLPFPRYFAIFVIFRV